MIKNRFFAFFSLISFVPSIVFAGLGDCFTATGFNESGFNGSYEETGTYNSYPSYTGETYYAYSTGGDGRIFLFKLATPLGNAGVNDWYYNNSSTGGVIVGADYDVGTIGSDPAGSIVADDCPVGGPDVSVSTTTLDIVYLSSNSFILYALSLVSTIALWKFLL